MICTSPFRKGMQEFPCGWCMPCRIADQRVWSTRNMLELSQHGDAVFVTLTFDDEHVPFSISKRDPQLYLKRLRRALHPRKVRYFACGEYGEESGRAHYHALLFGPSIFDQSPLTEAWQEQGFVHIGEVNEKTINYCTGYVLKGNKSANGRYADGRLNEFRIMSRGLGSNALCPKAGGFQAGIAEALSSGEDIPRGVRIGGVKRPIGRYLADRLRRDYVKSPEAVRVSAFRNRLDADRNDYDSTTERLRASEALRRQSGHQAEARLSIRSSLRKKL